MRRSKTPEEQIAKIIREHDRQSVVRRVHRHSRAGHRQLYSASRSTVTPRPKLSPRATSWTWRRASFPTRRSTTCIAISFRPAEEEEKSIPKGVVSKALMNVAFQDDGLIQYKAEVMLRIFEEQRDAAHRRPRQGDDRHEFPRGRVALFQHHQGKAQRARSEIQSPLCLLGFHASRNQRGNPASTPSTS